ncbi:MAG: hypothetical protein QOJ64_36 [Acidobacteriota bacterium]|jgi:hypothetical protein|nr:hypothetical protein [Acidobacteriota bacterium]
MSSFLRNRISASLLCAALLFSVVASQAQTARDAGGYSDSDVAARSRTTRTHEATNPTELLRDARTIFIKSNEYIDPEYLEYKLDKLPEFGQWNLAFVRDGSKADLVIEIHRTMLNYIFRVVDTESSVVVTKGKVVAINGLVAAEDISKEIVKRMRATRALPVND